MSRQYRSDSKVCIYLQPRHIEKNRETAPERYREREIKKNERQRQSWPAERITNLDLYHDGIPWDTSRDTLYWDK